MLLNGAVEQCAPLGEQLFVFQVELSLDDALVRRIDRSRSRVLRVDHGCHCTPERMQHVFQSQTFRGQAGGGLSQTPSGAVVEYSEAQRYRQLLQVEQSPLQSLRCDICEEMGSL